ncbi:efflux RND transporter permease subunit, partial [Nostoc linckia]|uniref:efflux RND transporter permease subunit n=1 Tax=Nostoc linckia TaxID=92942 RepID=UPI00117E80C2
VLKQLEESNPKVKFRVLFTRTQYTKEQYHSAMSAMIEGAVLAVVIVFLFLRDWRATVISPSPHLPHLPHLLKVRCQITLSSLKIYLSIL